LRPRVAALPLGLVLAASSHATAQLVVSGNENKIDLTSGAAQVVPGAAPDSLTILDFGVTPPGVVHLRDVPNSVIGPPSNVAVTPDGHWALVASSVVVDPGDPTRFVPDDVVRLVDLQASPPAVVGQARTGRQPSGLAIHPGGQLALVANRGSGSVTALALEGQSLRSLETLQVGAPADEICDVAFTPDGTRALAANRTRGRLHQLRVEGTRVEATGVDVTGYGELYHVEITPDGRLALTSGGGAGENAGAITVVDIETDPPRVLQVELIGTGPESFDISPDGRLVAAVLMAGSNLAPDDPGLTAHGGLVLLEIADSRLRRVQEIDVGRIPEGVTFTPDGRQLLVQYHPDRVLAIFDVVEGRLRDGGVRIPVPGMPSSIRAQD
jgi:DNA-binding beta-propeller fold protein YncE